MNDHDNGTRPTGGHDDDRRGAGRALDDLLVGALAGRSGQARPGAGSIRDVQFRARRRARRRTAVGGGMIVAVVALGVAFVGRNDDTGPRLTTGAGTPLAADDAGSAGPWECTGLLGTSTGAGATITSTIPTPVPTTIVFNDFVTTTSIMSDHVVTTTIQAFDGSVATTAPIGGQVISPNTAPASPDVGPSTTVSGTNDVVSSTTIDPVSTTTVLPSMVDTTVPFGIGGTSVPGDPGPTLPAQNPAATTYTLQFCTFLGAVTPSLDPSSQVSVVRTTPAPDTTVTATFDPDDSVPPSEDPGATVPAIRVDDTTATTSLTSD